MRRWMLSFVVVACAGKPVVPPQARPVNLPVAVAASDGAKTGCTDPPSLPAGRERGIDGFLADRAGDALRILDEAVRADPRDRAADVFRRAALAKREAGTKRLFAALEQMRPITLETPPWSPVVRRRLAVEGPKLRVDKESEKKNLITDDADWEKNNQLDRVRQYFPSADVPPMLMRETSRAVFAHADHTVVIYPSRIIVAAEGKKPQLFDARGAVRGPTRGLEVMFAQLASRTLLLALGYNGYAKESGGKNAWFAAFAADSGQLVWLSEPLVANAREAVVSGSSIVTGYGFTAEPDFLFVLDLASGRIEQKLPMKAGPSAIRRKGDRLFVRTYDWDVVLRAPSAIADAPPAALRPDEEEAPPMLGAEMRCWVRRATVAIGAKDRAALDESIAAVSPRSNDRVLFDVLREESERLGKDEGLDLVGAPLVRVAAPPWEAASFASSAPLPKTPKLVKLRTQKADPTRNMNPTFVPGKPWFIAPVKKGELPRGMRPDTPTSYGLEDLRAIIPSGDTTFLVYGGRYLASLKRGGVERVLDLETFRHPPRANPQWKEFAVQDVSFAQEKDGVVYVCNGGGSYAKEVFGKKGFLSALEASSGKLLWRSPPLTCNATFVITGDFIVSGYGFTDEPDFVFLVRRADGAVMQKVAVDSGPDEIDLDGNRVHVEAYGHTIDFELR